MSKKTTEVPADVCKLVGEDDLRIMIQFINNIYENGEWPKEVTDITIAFKKPKATKCSHHRMYSKDSSKILRTERKIEDIPGEDQFEFRRGKGTGEATQN
jgi:serine protease inhibitor